MRKRGESLTKLKNIKGKVRKVIGFCLSVWVFKVFNSSAVGEVSAGAPTGCELDNTIRCNVPNSMFLCQARLLIADLLVAMAASSKLCLKPCQATFILNLHDIEKKVRIVEEKGKGV